MIQIRFFLKIVCSLILLSYSGWLFSASISASQMQMLNSLSPAQKAKIAGIVGGGGQSVVSSNPPRKVSTKIKRERLIDKKKTATTDRLKDQNPTLQIGSQIIVYFNLTASKDEKNKKFNGASFVPEQPQQLFRLDRFGEIEISGIGRIAISGLSDSEAAARINLEPLLQNYAIKVLRLPIQQFGVTQLNPFGYDLFRELPEQMATDESMPVPKDYVVGPGDQIHIQLLGKENQEYLLEISRDATLALPGIGIFPVSGLNFDDLKRDIKKRIKKQLIGVDAFITLGQLRSIRIFVLGEVAKPGAYFVSGLATMTSALMFGEGISDIGSLRHIALKRRGKSVNKLDLYKLLLEGDTRNDQRLMPGDVIHVPTLTRTISIDGEIRRPAIYELDKEKTINDIIQLAGGLLPTAIRANVKIERVEDPEKKLIELNLSDKSSKDFVIKAGDIINVDSVMDRQENIVYLKGEILKPTKFQWTPALKISDIISSVRDLKPNADAEYLVIKRYLPPEFNMEILTVNLRKILQNPMGQENIKLKPLDELVVLSLSKKRILQINSIVDRLVAQSDSTKPSQIVRISGLIRGPGRYPLEAGMRIADLIAAGGQLVESAYTLNAELTRFTVEPGQPREIALLNINLRDAMLGKPAANLLLQPYDLLNIKEIPLWREEEHVEVVGEIQFPGRYTIQRGESLKALVKRAGGVTSFAFPQGAVFIREDLRKREQERIDAMAANLEAELASISLERTGDPGKIQSAGSANQLLSKLKGAAAAGRLVIDLQKIIDSDPENPAQRIFLRGGDKLYIPSQMQEVSVIGQVFHPTSHLFFEDYSVADYVGLSGGSTKTADNSSVYVIRANGAVQSAESTWLDDDLELLPGDTVVVPLDADRISSLKLWTDVSQIVYQLGLSAAAWNTVGLFK